MAILLNFELPTALNSKNFISELSQETHLQQTAQRPINRTFYDSFDWRLFVQGIVCEFNETAEAKALTFRCLQSGKSISSLKLNRVPTFAWDFPPGALRSKLCTIMEMRALLPLTTLASEIQVVNILNKDDKTVLRLLIEQYQALPTRVILQPIKGYDKALIKISQLLEHNFKLPAPRLSLLNAALALHKRKPLDYSSKLNIKLAPAMGIDAASKIILLELLNTIKINEAGALADTDSEFLHDFRVAVRRTRTGLSQLKGVFGTKETRLFSEFFAWLGKITGPTRDMDVYLLNFDAYKKSLPIKIREDLNPLRDFLVAKQKNAQQILNWELHSEQYRTGIQAWRQVLQQAAPNTPVKAKPQLSIKQLADDRIWKTYQRICKDGKAINEDSPAAALHNLRKTCKKLRYLMEFFQSLYPEKKIKTLIKTLKVFQEVLGDFQDYEVQETALKEFSNEMMKKRTPAATFLAMGILIQNLDRRRCKAREDFSQRFSLFNSQRTRDDFKVLFTPKKRECHENSCCLQHKRGRRQNQRRR